MKTQTENDREVHGGMKLVVWVMAGIVILIALICSCARAGTTTLTFTPAMSVDPEVVGSFVYYGTNSAVTNAGQDATSLVALGATQLDAGTNSRVMISGLTNQWYFTATSYSRGGQSTSCAGAVAWIPTNGLTLTLTNR